MTLLTFKTYSDNPYAPWPPRFKLFSIIMLRHKRSDSPNSTPTKLRPKCRDRLLKDPSASSLILQHARKDQHVTQPKNAKFSKSSSRDNKCFLWIQCRLAQDERHGLDTDLHDLARPELKEGLRIFLDLGQRAARDAREENACGLENGRGEALEEEQRHPTVSSTSLYLLKQKAAPHFKNIWTSSPSSRTDTSS
ncbi:uncharacterized protein RSE6_01084 [Rhynchosporium secalis]|uniref:Uncharacterized protein n=1 Tax=Rhynchosporium secalis TaxID=38038 RepID=A0A1E1LWV5_RHYSE|nr:uncharacterized protein RSE6_01084 [Rhynchosporium secalis]